MNEKEVCIRRNDELKQILIQLIVDRGYSREQVMRVLNDL